MTQQTAYVVSTGESPHARLRPVPIGAVTMGEGFWRPRMVANSCHAIPQLFGLLEEHGVLDNFRRIYNASDSARRGALFTDSDLFKWMEAAAWALASPTVECARELRRMLNVAIDTVLPAQGEDGYLNTYYADDRADQRFSRLDTDHELYCAGHMFQAAIAIHRVIGDRRLLDASMRFADYLCSVFGPQGQPGGPNTEQR